MAFIFNNIGMSYSALGDLDHALENIERARAVAEKAKFRPRVENALATLGDLELQRGHLNAAREYFARSLQLARELHDVGGEARALLGGARAAEARGEKTAAREQAQQAVALSRKVSQLDQLVPALTLLGRCAGSDAEARKAFEEAIAAVEEMRGRVAGGDTERETFFAQQIAPYHELVSLLVEQKEPEKALAMAERASARVLLDITNGGRAEWSKILTAAERAQQEQLNLKLAAARREAATVDAKKSAVALHEAERAGADFEETMQQTHPELRRSALPAPLDSLGTLTPLLHDGKTVLLRYVVTARGSFLFLVTSSPEKKDPQLQVISLGKNREELAHLTSAYRSRLALRSLTWEKKRASCTPRPRPILSHLQSVASVVIVPDARSGSRRSRRSSASRTSAARGTLRPVRAFAHPPREAGAGSG